MPDAATGADAAAAPSPWRDALHAAALLAIDPVGTGGAVLRAGPGPVRDRWLALLRDWLPADAPVRRMPAHIGDDRLLGGLDLAATLKRGRPVADPGLLVSADGGLVVAAMAERLPAATAARLGAVMDAGSVALERDGLTGRRTARFALVAFDEGREADEQAPAALLERTAFHLDLSGVSVRALAQPVPDGKAVHAARRRLARVRCGDDILEALCALAAQAGIASSRALLFALRVARAAAALAGRRLVATEDAALAARLVFASRGALATPPEAAPESAPPEPPPADAEAGRTADDDDRAGGATPDDVVLDAIRAALPPDLLARLAAGHAMRMRQAAGGRMGAQQQSRRRGRPVGSRPGDPATGARLDVIATLRAAAPWQRLRRRQAGGRRQRLHVQRDDFRITRYRERTETTTIFAVDASGSSALHRLAEAKGAVELLLAECYVRRDHVALVAFRGEQAELLLPPTRSLVRAKRGLASLPGGGGTPLAAGIDACVALAHGVRRRGGTPVIVLLTDGRANVARGGVTGRPQAEADALHAARLARAAGVRALLVDTSPQPQPKARSLAAAMDAAYLPLPHAGAGQIAGAVQSALEASA